MNQNYKYALKAFFFLSVFSGVKGYAVIDNPNMYDMLHHNTPNEALNRINARMPVSEGENLENYIDGYNMAPEIAAIIGGSGGLNAIEAIRDAIKPGSTLTQSVLGDLVNVGGPAPVVPSLSTAQGTLGGNGPIPGQIAALQPQVSSVATQSINDGITQARAKISNPLPGSLLGGLDNVGSALNQASTDPILSKIAQEIAVLKGGAPDLHQATQSIIAVAPGNPDVFTTLTQSKNQIDPSATTLPSAISGISGSISTPFPSSIASGLGAISDAINPTSSDPILTKITQEKNTIQASAGNLHQANQSIADLAPGTPDVFSTLSTLKNKLDSSDAISTLPQRAENALGKISNPKPDSIVTGLNTLGNALNQMSNDPLLAKITQEKAILNSSAQDLHQATQSIASVLPGTPDISTTLSTLKNKVDSSDAISTLPQRVDNALGKISNPQPDSIVTGLNTAGAALNQMSTDPLVSKIMQERTTLKADAPDLHQATQSIVSIAPGNPDVFSTLTQTKSQIDPIASNLVTATSGVLDRITFPPPSSVSAGLGAVSDAIQPGSTDPLLTKVQTQQTLLQGSAGNLNQATQNIALIAPPNPDVFSTLNQTKDKIDPVASNLVTATSGVLDRITFPAPSSVSAGLGSVSDAIKPNSNDSLLTKVQEQQNFLHGGAGNLNHATQNVLSITTAAPDAFAALNNTMGKITPTSGQNLPDAISGVSNLIGDASPTDLTTDITKQKNRLQGNATNLRTAVDTMNTFLPADPGSDIAATAQIVKTRINPVSADILTATNSACTAIGRPNPVSVYDDTQYETARLDPTAPNLDTAITNVSGGLSGPGTIGQNLQEALQKIGPNVTDLLTGLNTLSTRLGENPPVTLLEDLVKEINRLHNGSPSLYGAVEEIVARTFDPNNPNPQDVLTNINEFLNQAQIPPSSNLHDAFQNLKNDIGNTDPTLHGSIRTEIDRIKLGASSLHGAIDAVAPGFPGSDISSAADAARALINTPSPATFQGGLTDVSNEIGRPDHKSLFEDTGFEKDRIDATAVNLHDAITNAQTSIGVLGGTSIVTTVDLYRTQLDTPLPLNLGVGLNGITTLIGANPATTALADLRTAISILDNNATNLTAAIGGLGTVPPGTTYKQMIQDALEDMTLPPALGLADGITQIKAKIGGDLTPPVTEMLKGEIGKIISVGTPTLDGALGTLAIALPGTDLQTSVTGALTQIGVTPSVNLPADLNTIKQKIGRTISVNLSSDVDFERDRVNKNTSSLHLSIDSLQTILPDAAQDFYTALKANVTLAGGPSAVTLNGTLNNILSMINNQNLGGPITDKLLTQIQRILSTGATVEGSIGLISSMLSDTITTDQYTTLRNLITSITNVSTGGTLSAGLAQVSYQIGGAGVSIIGDLGNQLKRLNTSAISLKTAIDPLALAIPGVDLSSGLNSCLMLIDTAPSTPTNLSLGLGSTSTLIGRPSPASLNKDIRFEINRIKPNAISLDAAISSIRPFFPASVLDLSVGIGADLALFSVTPPATYAAGIANLQTSLSVSATTPLSTGLLNHLHVLNASANTVQAAITPIQSLIGVTPDLLTTLNTVNSLIGGPAGVTIDVKLNTLLNLAKTLIPGSGTQTNLFSVINLLNILP